jgi:DnaK suppressor protein
MTQEQLPRLQTVLESAEAEALQALQRERASIAVESCADEMEATSNAAKREAAIESAVRYSAKLRQIRDALSRIARDEFGICRRCEQEIAWKRLVVLPWTPVCLRCQESADRENRATRRAAAGAHPEWAA